jgi:hypothetical protein
MRRAIEEPPGGLSIRTTLCVNKADKEARGMKYILLIYGDEREWTSMSQEELAKVYEQHGAYGEAMVKAGVMRGGYELQPVATATSLRFTNGKPKTSDGPFAETKEQLGGYYIIEVDTLDQAIEWAEKMPAMSSGTVEIRPLGMGS